MKQTNFFSLLKKLTPSLEYIWIDAKMNLRSKTKYTTEKNPPIWNYDGSSTGQAEGTDSEVFLNPVTTFRDPFRKNHLKHFLPGGTRDWRQPKYRFDPKLFQ